MLANIRCMTELRPLAIKSNCFNKNAILPYGLEIKHVEYAMNRFVEFLTFINQQLVKKNLPPFEHFLMPANFSSIVGEFMSTMIPRSCETVTKNRYHNGHPDLVPVGMYEGDAILHGQDGIEVKASRYSKSWQGHNPENVWLIVFVFTSSSPNTLNKGEPPVSFRFDKVVGAMLRKTDWKYSGRSATSRRTITASVTASGYAKMESNWIYRLSDK